MNYLYIHAHDAGRYLSPYGYPMPTPRLMQFAQESTLFRQAYAVAPTCSPSRAGLMTGMTAHQVGMLGLAHRGFDLTYPSRHLAHFLRNQGYETALSGIQHEYAFDIKDKGYDHILLGAHDTEFPNNDRLVASCAADYLHKKKAKPFYLSCGFMLPHRDFPKADSAYCPDYLQPPTPLPDTPETRADMAAYMTAVNIMDECFGKVFDALHESGHAEDTIVVFTVDHGIAFPTMKCQLYDSGIGVALMIRTPTKSIPVSDALVSHLDVFPTLCDYLELDPPDWLLGHSLRSILEGSTSEVREDLFAEVTFHASYEPMRCVRTKYYKLIQLFGNELELAGANIDDSPSKDIMSEAGLLAQQRDEIQLYDLRLDPNERSNVAHNASYSEVLESMKQRLKQWMQTTNDPLYTAENVSAPGDAKIIPRSELSARSRAWEDGY